MKTVEVPLDNRPYNIVIGDENLGDCTRMYNVLSPFVKDRHCFIITDSNVADLYSGKVREILTAMKAGRLDQAVFPPGEDSKNLQTVESLYSQAVKASIDRDSVIIALGGGVVGDTAGFIAATYMRGIDLIQFPTSLVAQVDSSVGGKTGVDLQEGKNLVGAFHQPKLVLIDTSTLRTLPDRQLRCGLGEVVKYGVILDESFFSYLEANIEALLRLDAPTYEYVVLRCCQLKAWVVGTDELDHGLRAILNYGHTFGHALEKLTNYVGLTHGEAIAIGMGMAADLSILQNKSSSNVGLCQRQDALLKAIGLPTKIHGYSPQQVFNAMLTDKKFKGGKKRLILSEKIGCARVVSDIPDKLILQAIGARCDQ